MLCIFPDLLKILQIHLSSVFMESIFADLNLNTTILMQPKLSLNLNRMSWTISYAVVAIDHSTSLLINKRLGIVFLL